MEMNLIKTIAFEVGVISISAFASFILPGLTGVLVGGLIQFIGDALGLELYGGEFPSDPMWFITEFMALFGPYFAEMKFAKMESSLLRSIEGGLNKVEDVLTKVDDALMNSIEYLKKKASYQFSAEGRMSPAMEQEIKEVEEQELVREKFGSEQTKVKKKLNSFSPNTKNPDSWIAGVGFKETMRLGPRDIRGDLIITYYENNHHRVGYVLKPISKIILGRTSGGERKESNKSRYRKVEVQKNMGKVKIRKVVFKGARYYGDYLAFLKSYSWGGYYMRRWMIGTPGRKEGTNALILFGSLYRVYSKFRALSGDAHDLLTDTKTLIKSKSNEIFGSTRLGSKYNKINGAFSKANAIHGNPLQEASNLFKEKANSRRETIRQNKIK